MKARGQNAEAAPQFAEAIHILTPHFLQLPQAHVRLITQMYGEYIKACELARIEPDPKLLAPLLTVLNEMNSENSPQS